MRIYKHVHIILISRPKHPFLLFIHVSSMLSHTIDILESVAPICNDGGLSRHLPFMRTREPYLSKLFGLP